MLTAIEKFLFQRNTAHALLEITFSENGLAITVAPWKEPAPNVSAKFCNVRITSIEVIDDNPEDLNLPWDIIGFDCYELSGDRWRFVLHCIGIEYGFEALWPRIVSRP